MQKRIKLSDYNEVSSERSAVYSWLSTLFRDVPTKQIIENLTQASQLIDDTDSETAESAFFSHLLKIDTDQDAQLKELRTEFTRLFLGPHQIPAPPFESVYISKHKSLISNVTMSVRNFYRSSGFEAVKKGSQPEDNISLELEFMSRLCPNADTIMLQCRFLKEHLLTWVEKFCADIKQASALEFYVLLADWLCEFVSEDYKFLLTFVD